MMGKQLFSTPKKAFFRYGVWNVDTWILELELQSLRQKSESRQYWWTASFVVDRIEVSSEGVELYHIRRAGMRKDNAVMLQGNYSGIEYLHIDRIKEGKTDY